jgi:tetratricopeptide (TPR) repeat protein
VLKGRREARILCLGIRSECWEIESVGRVCSGARSITGWVNRIIVAIFVSSLTACVSVGSLPSTLGDTGRTAEEWLLLQRAGAQQRAMEEQGLIYDDEEFEHYLTQLVHSLQGPDVHKGMAFRVRVIRDTSPNALSFPDGGLYLTTGMLARLDNEAQLAILLAHEMAHCSQGHALRALRYCREALSTGSKLHGPGRGGQIPGAPQWGTSTPAVEAYLDGLEMEADRVGFQSVLKAGYDPAEGMKLFEDQQRDLGEDELEETTRSALYRHLEKRKESWQSLLAHRAQTEPRGLTNREAYLAHVHRVILENARLDERQGRFSLAQREVQNYLAVRPNDERAYYLLGEICRQRGLLNDRNKAKDWYAKAINIRPSFAEPYRGMGLLCYKEGEKRQAKSSFEAYLIHAPEAPDRAYIEKYLTACN